MIYEAKCRKCDETFNPADEGDRVHLVRQDGEECGGVGDMVGRWIQDGENPYADLDPEELAETMNDFGGDMAAAADHLRRLRDVHDHHSQ